MELTMSREEAKQLFKEAIVELMEERTDLFLEIVLEAIEEAGLAKAIQEGRKNEFVDETEILAILQERG